MYQIPSHIIDTDAHLMNSWGQQASGVKMSLTVYRTTRSRVKGKIRQQNKKKKGKKNEDSKKNVNSNVRIDGFENADANL